MSVTFLTNEDKAVLEQNINQLSEEKVSLEQVVISLGGAVVNLAKDIVWEDGFFYATGELTNEASEWYGKYMRSRGTIEVNPNTTYVAPLKAPLTIDYDNDRKAKLIIIEYDSNGAFLRRELIEQPHAVMTATETGYYGVVQVTIPEDAHYIKIAVTSYGVSPSLWFYFRADSDAPYGQKLLPDITQNDNGKVLGIVDGVYTPVDTNAGFVLSNNIKNDCARFSAAMRGMTEVDSFLFFTDPHLLQGENYDTKFIESVEQIKKYYNATPTAFVVCGGDWYGAYDTYDEACYKSAYASAWMRGKFDNYYPIIGNHDTNQSGVNNSNDGEGILTPETVRNLWNPCRDTNYYSFDGVHAKYYVLDTFGEVQSDSDYMRTQIAWLGDKLKSDDRANSAVLMHIGFTSSDGTFSPGTFVIAPHTEKILQMCAAYNAGEQVTINDVQHDFTGCEGKVRFILSGHTHYDCLDSTTGIPLIATTQLNQSGGLTFDLCAADYGNLKLQMVRVGDGESRLIDMAT